MAEKKKSFQDVVELMARLRAPDGCPWDREQTAQSLRTYLLEEAYEVLDAIEEGDTESLREELGDLLLQVVFHAQIAGEEGVFDIGDVLTTLHEKLVRRHPHVFGSDRADDAGQVKHNWEALKNAEKLENHSGDRPLSVLDGVSRHQPALLEAYQLARKASQVGFDWKQAGDVVTKLREETAELEETLEVENAARREEEMGDLLFAAVNVSRFLGIDPEAALRRANRKFISRFEQIEEALREQGLAPADATLEQMDAIWNQTKGSS